MTAPSQTALLIVDMQMEMVRRIEAGRPRTKAPAEENIAALAALFRAQGRPVLHVHHDQPGSGFERDLDGGAPMPCALPVPGEAIFYKSTSSGFTNTGLAEHLHEAGITDLVVVGGVEAFCVTSTVRAASELGFSVIVPRDGLIGFDIKGLDGQWLAAETISEVNLAVLALDFAEVMPTDELRARLSA